LEQDSFHNIGKIDKEVFEKVFRTFFSPLCAFASKYVNDYDTGKDIVHDVLLNFWDKRDSIDTSKSIKSYLFTSVYNRCLNFIRDRKKFSSTEGEMEIAENTKWESSDQLEAAELEDKINKALDELPEKCREVFLLNRYDGLKYKEIAEKLGISIKTVETQMSKALKILRERLAQYIAILVATLLSLFG